MKPHLLPPVVLVVLLLVHLPSPSLTLTTTAMDRDTEAALLSGDASRLNLGVSIGGFNANVGLGGGAKPSLSASYTTKGGSQFSLDINTPPSPQQGAGGAGGAAGRLGGTAGPTQDGINVNSVMGKIDAIVEALVEPQDEDDEVLMENFALLVCRKMQIEFDRYSIVHMVGCKGTRVECEEGFLAARSEFGRAADGIFKAASKQCRFMWGGVEDTEDDDDDDDDEDANADPLALNCKDRANGKGPCGEALREKEAKARKEMSNMVASALRRKTAQKAAEEAKVNELRAERKLTEEKTRFVQKQREALSRERERHRRERDGALARARDAQLRAGALSAEDASRSAAAMGRLDSSGPSHHKGKKCHHKHGKKCCSKRHGLLPALGQTPTGDLVMGAAPNAAGEPMDLIQTKATTKAKATTQDKDGLSLGLIDKLKAEFAQAEANDLKEVQEEQREAKEEAEKVEKMAAKEVSDSSSDDDDKKVTDESQMKEEEEANREMIARLKKKAV